MKSWHLVFNWNKVDASEVQMALLRGGCSPAAAAVPRTIHDRRESAGMGWRSGVVDVRKLQTTPNELQRLHCGLLSSHYMIWISRDGLSTRC